MPANVKKIDEQVLRNIVLNALNSKVENKKKLDEQLINVICDSKTKSDVKLKKVKYLVRLGANVNQKVNGKSLLKIAREKGDKEIEEVIKENLMKSFEKLLDGDKFERVLDDCEYANEHKVVVSEEKAINLGKKFWKRNGDLKSAKEIEVLILQGADVDVQVNEGRTALMCASREREDVVRILLEAGADVNIKDEDGWTALTDAAYGGLKEVVEMLLQKGADVNHTGDAGWTALMWASKEGHKEVVEMLLQNGADVNQMDVNSKTALMWASKEGHKEVLEVLIEGGADVKHKDRYGWTALKMATDKETKKVIKEHIKKTSGESYKDGGFLGKIFGGFGR